MNKTIREVNRNVWTGIFTESWWIMPKNNLANIAKIFFNESLPFTISVRCSVACWLLCLWNSPGKNIVVGCYSLLQVIFPTQGLNSGLLHCRQILYHLRYQRVGLGSKPLPCHWVVGVLWENHFLFPYLFSNLKNKAKQKRWFYQTMWWDERINWKINDTIWYKWPGFNS